MGKGIGSSPLWMTHVREYRVEFFSTPFDDLLQVKYWVPDSSKQFFPPSAACHLDLAVN